MGGSPGGRAYWKTRAHHRPARELGDEAFEQPREVFRSETGGGRKSYLINLGDIAFSSPLNLGGPCPSRGHQLQHLSHQRHDESKTVYTRPVDAIRDL